MINFNDLTLEERLHIVNHNSKLDKYYVEGRPFAIGGYVKVINNGIIRYITKKHDSIRFEDDGLVSQCDPSPMCHYEGYELIQ